MPGWFRIHQDLIESPKMLDAAHALSLDADLCHNGRDMPVEELLDLYLNVAIGALVRLWSYAETHIRADDSLPMSALWVDTMLRLPGFCEAMPDDWVEVMENGNVRLPDYVRKNELIERRESLERKRAYDAEYQRNRRASSGRRERVVNDTPGNRSASSGSEAEAEAEAEVKTGGGGTGERAKPDYDSVANLDPGAWAAWLAYRRAEKMRAYRSTQVATKLSKFPAAEQRAAVEESITAGWQGLFPKNDRSKTSGRGRTFEDSTRRLGEWYLEQTGHVLPVDG